MRYNINFKDNNYLTPTTYTQELSEYAVGLKYEDIPAEVVERAKMIMLQTIGAALAAKDTPIAQKMCKIALEGNNGNGGPNTVWGMGKKMSAVNASFVVSSMADILDWEDCSWTGHPSAGIIPCAWLAAEERKKSGKDLITSIVAAYEVYQRIAMAVQPSAKRWKEKGWGMNSWQVFGCTVAVSKIYGLDARKMNQAITMSCEASTLPIGVNLSDFYHYEFGFRSRDGFLISKAVEKGINNNLDGLDAPCCYTAVLCGKIGGTIGEEHPEDSEADMTWMNRDLGSKYLIMETLMKHWPANMWVQTPAEIMANLIKEHQFGPDDVEQIVLDPPIDKRMWAPEEGFTNVTLAEFSVPYVASVMLYHPEPGAYWYTPEMMKDPKIAAMMQRVKGGDSDPVLPMEGFMKFRKGEYPMSTITVTLKDGRTVSGKMDRHPGHPANMMTREEFSDRFRTMTRNALGEERMEKVLDILCNIENVDDISGITHLLM